MNEPNAMKRFRYRDLRAAFCNATQFTQPPENASEAYRPPQADSSDQTGANDLQRANTIRCKKLENESFLFGKASYAGAMQRTPN
jgi:hydroxyacyl-ACP dehydratase HTD2-like protein with hotdog domain